MKLCRRLLLSAFLMTMIAGCMKEDVGGFLIFNHAFDFSESEHGWQYGFSDFPVNSDTATYEMRYAYTNDPTFPNDSRKSLMLSGFNRSNDLFMYIKKKLTDLEPDTEYIVTFEVELSSNAGAGIILNGGSPGETVYLKAGATFIEPKSVIEAGNYIMNIDKGNQSTGGEQMIVIGNIAVPSNTSGYTSITRSNASYNTPLTVRSSSNGEIWLIVGTDSAYKGPTKIYYTKINAVFSKSGR